MELQDEALLYLRDNITKDEAYYILTTDKEMLAILIADKKDGSKRIKILDAEYTIERDGIKKAFEDYIMSVPSIFRIHIADCDIRYLLRSWGVEFDEDDDEIYILYKRIIREVFFKMCEDMKVC